MLICGVVGIPAYMKKQWPRDWEWWAIPIIVVWIVASGASFFLFEWMMGRA
jgi:hypothetical protein